MFLSWLSILGSGSSKSKAKTKSKSRIRRSPSTLRTFEFLEERSVPAVFEITNWGTMIADSNLHDPRANPTNPRPDFYEVIEAGPDGIFGTTDDITTTVDGTTTFRLGRDLVRPRPPSEVTPDSVSTTPTDSFFIVEDPTTRIHDFGTTPTIVAPTTDSLNAGFWRNIDDAVDTQGNQNFLLANTLRHLTHGAPLDLTFTSRAERFLLFPNSFTGTTLNNQANLPDSTDSLNVFTALGFGEFLDGNIGVDVSAGFTRRFTTTGLVTQEMQPNGDIVGLVARYDEGALFGDARDDSYVFGYLTQTADDFNLLPSPLRVRTGSAPLDLTNASVINLNGQAVFATQTPHGMSNGTRVEINDVRAERPMNVTIPHPDIPNGSIFEITVIDDTHFRADGLSVTEPGINGTFRIPQGDPNARLRIEKVLGEGRITQASDNFFFRDPATNAVIPGILITTSAPHGMQTGATVNIFGSAAMRPSNDPVLPTDDGNNAINTLVTRDPITGQSNSRVVVAPGMSPNQFILQTTVNGVIRSSTGVYLPGFDGQRTAVWRQIELISETTAQTGSVFDITGNLNLDFTVDTYTLSYTPAPTFTSLPQPLFTTGIDTVNTLDQAGSIGFQGTGYEDNGAQPGGIFNGRAWFDNFTRNRPIELNTDTWNEINGARARAARNQSIAAGNEGQLEPGSPHAQQFRTGFGQAIVTRSRQTDPDNHATNKQAFFVDGRVQADVSVGNNQDRIGLFLRAHDTDRDSVDDAYYYANIVRNSPTMHDFRITEVSNAGEPGEVLNNLPTTLHRNEPVQNLTGALSGFMTFTSNSRSDFIRGTSPAGGELIITSPSHGILDPVRVPVGFPFPVQQFAEYGSTMVSFFDANFNKIASTSGQTNFLAERVDNDTFRLRDPAVVDPLTGELAIVDAGDLLVTPGVQWRAHALTMTFDEDPTDAVPEIIQSVESLIGVATVNSLVTANGRGGIRGRTLFDSFDSAANARLQCSVGGVPGPCDTGNPDLNGDTVGDVVATTADNFELVFIQPGFASNAVARTPNEAIVIAASGVFLDLAGFDIDGQDDLSDNILVPGAASFDKDNFNIIDGSQDRTSVAIAVLNNVWFGHDTTPQAPDFTTDPEFRGRNDFITITSSRSVDDPREALVDYRNGVVDQAALGRLTEQFRSGVITNVTNTAPITITTEFTHRLKSGDRVRIQNVTGNTAANGVFFVTVTGPNTFQLNNTVGNGLYLGGGTWTGFQEQGELLPEQGAFIHSEVRNVSVAVSVYSSRFGRVGGQDNEASGPPITNFEVSNLRIHGAAPHKMTSGVNLEYLDPDGDGVNNNEVSPTALGYGAIEFRNHVRSLKPGTAGFGTENSPNGVDGRGIRAQGQVIGATNTRPITITTGTPHGLTTGTEVTIVGVNGNTNANGTFVITVIGPSQFRLNGTQGNGLFSDPEGDATWSVNNRVTLRDNIIHGIQGPAISIAVLDDPEEDEQLGTIRRVINNGFVAAAGVDISNNTIFHTGYTGFGFDENGNYDPTQDGVPLFYNDPRGSGRFVFDPITNTFTFDSFTINNGGFLNGDDVDILPLGSVFNFGLDNISGAISINHATAVTIEGNWIFENGAQFSTDEISTDGNGLIGGLPYPTFGAADPESLNGTVAIASVDSNDLVIDRNSIHTNAYGGILTYGFVGGAVDGLTVTNNMIIRNGSANDVFIDVESDGAPNYFLDARDFGLLRWLPTAGPNRWGDVLVQRNNWGAAICYTADNFDDCTGRFDGANSTGFFGSLFGLPLNVVTDEGDLVNIDLGRGNGYAAAAGGIPVWNPEAGVNSVGPFLVHALESEYAFDLNNFEVRVDGRRTLILITFDDSFNIDPQIAPNIALDNTRYTLRWAGADDLLGTEDDQIFRPTELLLTTTERQLQITFPSIDGVYEFKIRGFGVDRPDMGGALVDIPSNNWINGDQDFDQLPGGNFIRIFQVDTPEPVVERVVSQETGAVPFFTFQEPREFDLQLFGDFDGDGFEDDIANFTEARFIAAASNTTPIVIRSAVPHGLVTGETVRIQGVQGNTAANNTVQNREWTVTVVDDDEFILNNSVGNGNYTSGGNFAGNPDFTRQIFQNTWFVNTSNGSNFNGSRWDTGFPLRAWIEHVVGNYDGASGDDILSISDTGEVFVQLSRGFQQGFQPTGDLPWIVDPTILTATVFHSGDFNGDGREDLATLQADQWVVYQSVPNSLTFRRVVYTGLNERIPKQTLVGDFNGDDVDDIANLLPATGVDEWVMALGVQDPLNNTAPNGRFLLESWGTTPPNTIGWNTSVALDANGDGRTDIAMLNNQPGQTLDGSQTFGRWYLFLAEPSPAAIIVNGRELADRFRAPIATDAVLLNTNQIVDVTNTSPVVITTLNEHGLETGDTVSISGVNGNPGANGRFTINVTGPTTFVLVNSLTAGNYLGGGTVFSSKFSMHQAVDFNGDGRDDIASFDETRNTWVASISSGDALRVLDLLDPRVPNLTAPAGIADWNWFIGNFDNDKAGALGIGTDDFVSYDAALGVFRAYIVQNDPTPLDDVDGLQGTQAVQDSFVGANGLPINPAVWDRVVGTFQFQNNMAFPVPQNDTTTGQPIRQVLAVRTGGIASDVRVSANIRIVGASDAPGLVARYTGQGDRNMYGGFLVLNGTATASLEIWRNTNGLWVQLASVAVPAPANGTSPLLTFEIEGQELRVELMYDAADPALAAQVRTLRVVDESPEALRNAGVTGMRTFLTNPTSPTRSTFDNFVSRELTRTVFGTEPFTTDSPNSLGPNFTLRDLAGAPPRVDLFTQGGVAGVVSQDALSKIATVDGLMSPDAEASVDVTSLGLGDAVVLVARHAQDGNQMVMGVLFFDTVAGPTVSIWNRTTQLTQSVLLLPNGDPIPTPTPGSPLRMRFEAVGPELRLFLNIGGQEQLVLTTVDPTTLNTGRVGIYALDSSQDATAVSFDNFRGETLPPELPVVADTFNDRGLQERPNLGVNWDHQLPGLTIDIFGRVVHAAGAPNRVLDIYNGVFRTDVAVEVDVQFPETLPTSSQAPGLVLRYQGPGDQRYYGAALIRNSEGVFGVIYRMDLNDNFSFLAMSANLGVDLVQEGQAIINLRFEAEGSNLRLLVNDSVVATAEDSVISVPGRVGIRSIHDGQTILLDNFRALTIEPEFSTADVFDAFDRGPAPTLGTDWTAVGTVVDALSGLPIQIDSAGKAHAEVAVFNRFQSVDVTASVEVQIRPDAPDDVYGGVFARYVGDNPNFSSNFSFYAGVLVNRNGGTQAEIWLYRAGQVSVLATARLGFGRITDGNLRLEIVGDQLSLFVDDIIVAGVVNAILPDIGFTGFFSGTDPDNPAVNATEFVSFDDFTAQRQ